MPGPSPRSPAPLALLLLQACAAIPAPTGFLPAPALTGATVFGGWAVVQTTAPSQRSFEGELIAIDADSLWLLAPAVDGAFALRDIRRAEVWGYLPEGDKAAGLAALGTLSTAANGLLLVFTAPAWIIGGSVAAAGQSRTSRVISSPPGDWRKLQPWARFPQGLPPGVALAGLRPKPG